MKKKYQVKQLKKPTLSRRTILKIRRELKNEADGSISQGTQ
jgi:hypothetical protein